MHRWCLEHFVCSNYAACRAAVSLRRDKNERDEEKGLETLSRGEITLVSLLESELSTLTLFILLYYDCTDPLTWFKSWVESVPLRFLCGGPYACPWYITRLICIHFPIVGWCTSISLILRVRPCHPIACIQVCSVLIESY